VVLWKWSRVFDDLILGEGDWSGLVVVAPVSRMSPLGESVQIVALLAHHDSQDDDHHNLEDGPSGERLHPEWMLGDVCLDGPESLLAHVEDSNADEEGHDAHGFQDVVRGELGLGDWFSAVVLGLRWA
jgi:hypothetical protein